MEPYRIVVVDDSAFMRKLFSDIIKSDPSFVVIAVGKTGRDAVELHRSLRPDAITLDLEMPEMNGLEALDIIASESTTPVIMLSGISDENTAGTIAALQRGAFDFIRKPSGPATDVRQVAEALLLRLKTAMTMRKKPAQQAAKAPPEQKAGTKPDAQTVQPVRRGSEPRGNAAPAPGQSARRPRSPAEAVKKPAAEPAVPSAIRKPKPEVPVVMMPAAHRRNEAFRHVIAIGTSTGGPRALHQLLSELPADIGAPVLIVQHMPPRFTQSLAQRLNTFSALTVKEAEHGEPVLPGVAYVAPGGYHMELAAADKTSYVIRLSQSPPRNGHRPSVDTLFESLVPFVELNRHAVIMTGMGSDGSRGMKVLADHGAASLIAESEETCIVYGMPRSAIENGAAATVLPLHAIAANLADAVKR